MRPVEHPGRDMHAACSLFRAQIASKDSFAAALNHVLDITTRPPWMPWIKHLSSFGNMGFAAFACTTTAVRIRAFAD
jgi:hypothetical protein